MTFSATAKLEGTLNAAFFHQRAGAMDFPALAKRCGDAFDPKQAEASLRSVLPMRIANLLVENLKVAIKEQVFKSASVGLGPLTVAAKEAMGFSEPHSVLLGSKVLVNSLHAVDVGMGRVEIRFDGMAANYVGSSHGLSNSSVAALMEEGYSFPLTLSAIRMLHALVGPLYSGHGSSGEHHVGDTITVPPRPFFHPTLEESRPAVEQLLREITPDVLFRRMGAGFIQQKVTHQTPQAPPSEG